MDRSYEIRQEAESNTKLALAEAERLKAEATLTDARAKLIALPGAHALVEAERAEDQTKVPERQHEIDLIHAKASPLAKGGVFALYGGTLAAYCLLPTGDERWHYLAMPMMAFAGTALLAALRRK